MVVINPSSLQLTSYIMNKSREKLDFFFNLQLIAFFIAIKVNKMKVSLKNFGTALQYFFIVKCNIFTFSLHSGIVSIG